MIDYEQFLKEKMAISSQTGFKISDDELNQNLYPLQIDIVNRLIERYSNKGDVVGDFFAGIGTVPYCSILQGRKAFAVELNYDYYRDGIAYCEEAEAGVTAPTLFDLIKQ